MLAINKIDLLSDINECLFYDKIQEFANSEKLEVFHISAKDNIGIKELFDHLIDQIISRKVKLE